MSVSQAVGARAGGAGLIAVTSHGGYDASWYAGKIFLSRETQGVEWPFSAGLSVDTVLMRTTCALGHLNTSLLGHIAQYWTDGPPCLLLEASLELSQVRGRSCHLTSF